MPISLESLLVPSPPSPSKAIPLDELVAQPGFAPRDWQSVNPVSVEPMWASKPPVTNSPDLRRIVALPRRNAPAAGESRGEALIELMTQRFARANPACQCMARYKRECITRLRLAQAWALYEIGLKGGLFGPIGVGHGKTIIDILAPLALRDCRLAVLLVPPTLVGQLVTEYRLLSEHFNTPALVVHGKADILIKRANAPVLHVFPYSRLSRPEATTFLERLGADAIIADECHKLRHADTATTSRVLRYFDSHPATRFCAWSGSVTDSSIGDYAHLSALALRDGSPVPQDPIVVDEWARALDPGDFPAPPGALLDLCEPGEHIYEGFHRRLTETAGVVTTDEPAIKAELRITERVVSFIPESVQLALKDVRNTWVRPDGEEIVEALALDRCLRQLACGFYYRWIFPRGESVALILEWLEARKQWRRELRDKLKTRQEHLDSPRLCALAAMRAYGEISNEHDLPAWKAMNWPRWKKAKGTVKPETEAVRIDDFLARDAAVWGKENKGVIWVEHTAFGEWVSSLSGLPLHVGGPEAGKFLAAEKGDRSIVASIKSHGTGRDGLQRIFNTQLVANPPSTPTAWEQMLGRLHRIGQQSLIVTAHYYGHTQEMKRLIDTALMRAVYVEQTIGSNQKLSVISSQNQGI